MNAKAKLRWLGGGIIIFNLWLIGQYSITGFPVLLLTVGVAVAVELWINSRTTTPPPLAGTPAVAAQPRRSPVRVYVAGLFGALMIAGLVVRAFQFVSNEVSAPDKGEFVPYTGPLDPVKPLGFIDQWRFDSCMTDAAKNPTAHGVNTAATVCRRRFNQ